MASSFLWSNEVVDVVAGFEPLLLLLAILSLPSSDEQLLYPWFVCCCCRDSDPKSLPGAGAVEAAAAVVASVDKISFKSWWWASRHVCEWTEKDLWKEGKNENRSWSLFPFWGSVLVDEGWFLENYSNRLYRTKVQLTWHYHENYRPQANCQKISSANFT